MIELYNSEDVDWLGIVAVLALAGVVLAATVVGIGMLSGATAANNSTTNVDDVAPYYANNSTEVNNESWMSGHENATLDNMVSMATRVGGFVIGNQQAQDGVGPANGLVLALVVFGVVATAGARSRVGTVGGIVLGIASAATLSTVGLAPRWLFAIIVFGVGLVAAAALLRILN